MPKYIFSALLAIVIVMPMAASAADFPRQEVNLGYFNTVRYLNITGYGNGSILNTWVPNGGTNENWYIKYISANVYEIENATTGKLITAHNDSAALWDRNNSNQQKWKLIGLEKDFLGEHLYYQIVNVATNQALKFNAVGNRVTLATPSATQEQKWRIDLVGLHGFAATSTVREGVKAGTIGGTLGPVVEVRTDAEIRAALENDIPQTVVVAATVDCRNMGRDYRIGKYKTLVGAYNVGKLLDVRLRTNFNNQDDGFPSDNIVIRNMTFGVESNDNHIVVQVYSSKNVWFDHNTFYSTRPKHKDEVGKFIWINTPFEGRDKSRSPDFVTLSYNIFRNRYWCVAYGTQNGITNEDRSTVAYNIWDSNVRRTPQIGNGILHSHNNYHVRNTTSTDNAGLANIIAGEGSEVYTERNRFDLFRKESSGYWDQEITVDKNATFKDNGSYTNKTESGAASVVPTLLSVSGVTSHSWLPSSNYGYKLVDAYNTQGTDTKDFCLAHSGAQSQFSAINYLNASSMSNFVSKTHHSPFLQSITVSEPPPPAVSSSAVSASSAAVSSSSIPVSSSSTAISSSSAEGVSSGSVFASSSSEATTTVNRQRNNSINFSTQGRSLHISSAQALGRITLSNALGQQISTNFYSGQSAQIAGQHLSRGLWIVTVQSLGGTQQYLWRLP